MSAPMTTAEVRERGQLQYALAWWSAAVSRQCEREVEDAVEAIGRVAPPLLEFERPDDYGGRIGVQPHHATIAALASSLRASGWRSSR